MVLFKPEAQRLLLWNVVFRIRESFFVKTIMFIEISCVSDVYSIIKFQSEIISIDIRL